MSQSAESQVKSRVDNFGDCSRRMQNDGHNQMTEMTADKATSDSKIDDYDDWTHRSTSWPFTVQIAFRSVYRSDILSLERNVRTAAKVRAIC